MYRRAEGKRGRRAIPWFFFPLVGKENKEKSEKRSRVRSGRKKGEREIISLSCREGEEIRGKTVESGT